MSFETYLKTTDIVVETLMLCGMLFQRIDPSTRTERPITNQPVGPRTTRRVLSDVERRHSLGGM